MPEREVSAEEKFFGASAIVATGIAVTEAFVGHNVPVDLVTSLVLLNAHGIPVTPILQVVENSFKELRQRFLKK